MILHLFFASLCTILTLFGMVTFVIDQKYTNDTIQILQLWLTTALYSSNSFMIYIVYKLSELKDSEQNVSIEGTETEQETVLNEDV